MVKNDGNVLVTYVRVQLCCSKFRTILIFEKLKTLSLKLKPVHDLALLKIVVLLVPGGVQLSCHGTKNSTGRVQLY